MDVIEEIKKLSDSIEETNNKMIFHSDGGFQVSAPKFSGIFNDIVLDNDKLLFFSDAPFARIVTQNEWDSIIIN